MILLSLYPIATAAEYPSVSVVWICDISKSMSEKEEALRNAYELFQNLLGDIVDSESKIITMRENAAVKKWSDKINLDFEENTNVVSAFSEARNIVSTASDNGGRIELVIFTDFCQTIAVNDDRSKREIMKDTDQESYENAQNLLNEDLEALKRYIDEGRLNISIMQWTDSSSKDAGYSPLVLPDWARDFVCWEGEAKDKESFESVLCEQMGMLYAKMLTGKETQWQGDISGKLFDEQNTYFEFPQNKKAQLKQT